MCHHLNEDEIKKQIKEMEIKLFNLNQDEDSKESSEGVQPRTTEGEPLTGGSENGPAGLQSSNEGGAKTKIKKVTIWKTEKKRFLKQ